MMMISFRLHLNRQNMARATENIKLVKNYVPIMFFPFAIGLWVQFQKVSKITHINNGV
jgi:hypothetical protein